MSEQTSVLISGGGVAGLALAHWLDRYGFAVTVVERAPGMRPGGHAVDLRGPALEVADRMGIGDAVRERRTRMHGMSVVDGDGNELYRSTEYALSSGDLNDPTAVEILRDDLAGLLHGAVSSRVVFRYDDAIADLEQRPYGVRVRFERGAAEDVDLVVGADGLHSRVRALAFGPERDFIRHLGMYLGVFTTPNFTDLRDWQVWYNAGAVGGALMTARDSAELRCYLGFAADPIDYDIHDVAAQKALMSDRLSGCGWHIPAVLSYLPDAPDFTFDSMSQIHLPSWSAGRITLLGDAGYCGSPLSGQGTSMAMVGAYTLAGELAASAGHTVAFAGYEKALRDWVSACQEIAQHSRETLEAMEDGDALPAGEDSATAHVTEAANALRLREYPVLSR